MESPLYFTMPLRKRLELVKQHELGLSSSNLRDVLLNWVKDGSSQNPSNDHQRADDVDKGE